MVSFGSLFCAKAAFVQTPRFLFHFTCLFGHFGGQVLLPAIFVVVWFTFRFKHTTNHLPFCWLVNTFGFCFVSPAGLLTYHPGRAVFTTFFFFRDRDNFPVCVWQFPWAFETVEVDSLRHYLPHTPVLPSHTDFSAFAFHFVVYFGFLLLPPCLLFYLWTSSRHPFPTSTRFGPYLPLPGGQTLGHDILCLALPHSPYPPTLPVSTPTMVSLGATSIATTVLDILLGQFTTLPLRLGFSFFPQLAVPNTQF